MPFSDKGNAEDVEALVDTLTIDGAALNEANLNSLSTTDIQQLAELSQELHMSQEMDTEESEVIIETVEESAADEDVVMEAELGAHEVEIETEHAPPSPEEILPDVRTSIVTSTASATTKTTSVPPLRPLTIAPKPAKVPIAMKPLPGQQLLLLQGTTSNQAIKLVSSQGQELNFTNLSLGRPVAIKPAVKTLTTSQGNISLVQPKQVVMKKIITTSGQKLGNQKPIFTTNKQGHIMVVQKSDQVKLVSNQTTLPSPTKTITLQQAQEMGLITTSKVLQPQATSTPKHAVVLNKQGQKTIKIVPQGTPTQLFTSLNQKTVTAAQIKSPTRILPATQTSVGGQSKVPQRIIFKSAGTGTTILPSAQIIQVAGTPTLSSGQLHQINIPGKGMQYIKFVPATNAETLPSTTVKTSVQASPTNIVLSDVKSVSTTNIAPKTLKTIAAKNPATQGQVVMLPTYVQSQISSKVPIPMRHAQAQTAKQVTTPPDPLPVASETNLESNGMRPRKPCNCTKSQCLKLYCDCFANGEFCYMCNCMNCFNNLENEDHRQRAIRTCLERNPNAFRPKIGKAKDVLGDVSVRKHTKGCNCKRSGCLKNYCECYEAKIACSNNCKCVGCRNIEDSLEKKGLRSIVEDQQPSGKMIPIRDSLQFRPRRTSHTKQAINFITEDVIEATAQCILTISNSEEANMQDEDVTKSQIIEEFGRCLREIIDYSSAHN